MLRLGDRPTRFTSESEVRRILLRALSLFRVCSLCLLFRKQRIDYSALNKRDSGAPEPRKGSRNSAEILCPIDTRAGRPCWMRQSVISLYIFASRGCITAAFLWPACLQGCNRCRRREVLNAYLLAALSEKLPPYRTLWVSALSWSRGNCHYRISFMCIEDLSRMVSVWSRFYLANVGLIICRLSL